MNGNTVDKVTIGGEVFILPAIMNFATLERVWPAVKALAESPDDMGRTSAALACVSALMLPTRPELTVAELKKRLKVNALMGGDERGPLFLAVTGLLERSGLVRRGEEAPPGDKPLGDPADATESQTSNIS